MLADVFDADVFSSADEVIRFVGDNQNTQEQCIHKYEFNMLSSLNGSQ